MQTEIGTYPSLAKLGQSHCLKTINRLVSMSVLKILLRSQRESQLKIQGFSEKKKRYKQKLKPGLQKKKKGLKTIRSTKKPLQKSINAFEINGMTSAINKHELSLISINIFVLKIST